MIHEGQAAEAARAGARSEGISTRPAQSYWSQSWERLRANRLGMAAAGVGVAPAAI